MERGEDALSTQLLLLVLRSIDQSSFLSLSLSPSLSVLSHLTFLLHLHLAICCHCTGSSSFSLSLFSHLKLKWNFNERDSRWVLSLSARILISTRAKEKKNDDGEIEEEEKDDSTWLKRRIKVECFSLLFAFSNWKDRHRKNRSSREEESSTLYSLLLYTVY